MEYRPDQTKPSWFSKALMHLTHTHTRTHALIAELKRARGVVLVALIPMILGGLAYYCGSLMAPVSNPGGAFDLPPLIDASSGLASHDFEVRNSTKEKVRILDVRASCACAKFELSKTTLEPWESATLKLYSNAPKSKSDRLIFCTLITDHIRFKEWVYKLRVTTYPKLQFDSPSIDLGEIDLIDPHASSSTTISYFTNLNAPLPNKPEITASDGIDVSLTSKPSIERLDRGVQRVSYEININYKRRSSEPLGLRAGEVKAIAENGPAASLRVVWRCISPIINSPTITHFGVVSPNQRASVAAVLIKSVDEKPFTITKISADNPLVTAKLNENSPSNAKSTHRINLSLVLDRATLKSRALAGEVTVSTDRPGCPELRIPWSAFVEQPTGNPD